MPGFGAAVRPFLGRFPERVRMKPFSGPRDTLGAMEEIALGARGEKSPVVRSFTEWVTRDVWPKDYLGEILAVRNAMLLPSPSDPTRRLFRYTNDPRHVEWIKDPQRMVEEIVQQGTTACDCDELSLMMAVMLLQLGREVEFVALGFEPGQLTHVGVRVKEPKSGRWIWCDPVAGPREREAAQKAKEMLTRSLD
jgi:hypothetical protein